MTLPFNVRVYGILIHEGKLLVSDERYGDFEFTKLPGGGLQFGEGTIECLKREFLEEAELEIDVVQHFYTVDFFQPSAFNPNHQVISIYYLVQPAKNMFEDPSLNAHNEHRLRWVPLSEVSSETFTLPIDKHVAGKITRLDLA